MTPIDAVNLVVIFNALTKPALCYGNTYSPSKRLVLLQRKKPVSVPIYRYTRDSADAVMGVSHYMGARGNGAGPVPLALSGRENRSVRG